MDRDKRGYSQGNAKDPYLKKQVSQISGNLQAIKAIPDSLGISGSNIPDIKLGQSSNPSVASKTHQNLTRSWKMMRSLPYVYTFANIFILAAVIMDFQKT